MNGIKRLACVLIVFGAAVLPRAANAGDFGAGAWTRTATTSFTPDPQNLIAGMMPTDYNWGTRSEGSGTNETLTDGAGGFDATSKKTTFGNSSYVCYHLGDAAWGYMVTMVRLTTGTWASRDNATISSIQFKFVGSDDWETLPDSGVNHSVNSAGISTLAKTAEVDYLASGVTDIRINFGIQETKYVGYGEIEVCGTALDKVFGENYELADIVTDSKIITGSPTVALVGLVIPDGCDEWQQNESEETGDLKSDGWVSLTTPPMTQTFVLGDPDADCNLKGCTWFRNSKSEDLPVLCRSSFIRYSATRPVITAPASISRVLRKTGAMLADDTDEFVYGGGVSQVTGSEDIQLTVTGTSIALTAGGEDADDNPHTVQVMAAGTYEATIFATNDVGRVASQSVEWTVVVVPPTISAPASVTRELHKQGVCFNADESIFSYSGGSSAVADAEGLELFVEMTAMTLKSGGEDADPDPKGVRLMAAGEYVLTLYATNNLGAGVSQDVAVTVIEIPDYDGTITWTGATSTDPLEASNWSPAMVPTDGDAVIVPVTTTSLTLPAARHPEFGRYASFVIEAGATVVCSGNTSTPKGFGPSVFADEIVVDGTIDANGKGFAAGAGPGGWNEGAAHAGGVYGKGTSGLYDVYYRKDCVDAAGHLIFNPREPTELGSGGSGPGGGAIRLSASAALTLNGTISANAGNRGAGGSIWLQAKTLHGMGSATAKSVAYSSRAGAGGAIAVEYETSDFTGSWDVAGTYGSASSGEYGTIYEPNRFPRGTAEHPATVVLPTAAAWVLDGGDYYWTLSTADNGDAGVWLDDGTLHLGDHQQAQGIIRIGEWSHPRPDNVTRVTFGSLALSGSAKLVLPPARDDPIIQFDAISIVDSAVLVVGLGDDTTFEGHGQTLAVAGDCTIAGVLSGVGRGFDSSAHPIEDYGGPHGGATGGGDAYGVAWAPTSLGSCTRLSNNNDSGLRGGGAVKLEVAGTLTVEGKIDCRPANASDCRGAGGSIFIEAARFTGSGTLDAGAVASANRYGGGGRIAIYSPNNTFDGTKRVQTAIANSNCSIAGTVFIESSANTSAYAFGAGPKLSCDYTQQSFAKTVLSGGANVSSSSGSSNLASSSMCCERQVAKWKKRELAWTEKWYLTKSASGATNVKVDNTATYTLSSLTPNCQYIIEVNGSELVNADSSNGQFRTDGEGKLTFAADLANAENSISVCRNLRPMLLYLK